MVAIRTSVNATTGFSPFSLMFGREFRPFTDNTIMNWGQQHEAEMPLVVSALVTGPYSTPATSAGLTSKRNGVEATGSTASAV